MISRHRIWAALLTPLVTVGLGLAANKRALLVGIGKYLPKPAGEVAPWKPTALRKVPVIGTSNRETIPQLYGPPNDVENMKRLLVERYKFDEKEIRILRDQEATADNIIKTFQDFLVEGAAEHDIRVFYFSGHGSRIANRSPKAKADGFDEAIVPADALLGVPDIRDKELGRLYRSVPKGVTLTVIQDSCYSGSASRGTMRFRNVDDDGRYVVDPPLDDKTEPPPSPEKMGVLVVSASQNDEKSVEMELDNDKRTQGLFTWSLFHTLWDTPNESMNRVFDKVRNLMAAQAQAVGSLTQEPVLGGVGRMRLGLLGEPPNSNPAAAAIVRNIDTDSKTITISGGIATGLFTGCELQKLGKEYPAKLKITKPLGLYESEAEPIGSVAGLKKNDELAVTLWVMPPEAALRVYIPPAIERAQLLASVHEFQKLRARKNTTLADSSVRTGTTHVLSWRGGDKGWVLERAGKPGEAILHANATAAAIAAKLPPTEPVNLLIVLPPVADLAEALPFEAGSQAAAAIRVLHEPTSEADYALEGRLAEDRIEYSWVIANLPGDKGAASSYPVQSKGVAAETGKAKDAGRRLADIALRLATIRSWLTLPNPPDKIAFPYHLALVDVSTHKTMDSQPLVAGQRLKLALTAGEPDLKAYQDSGGDRAWIYVFVIDSSGKGTLVFPALGEGNVGNRFPIDTGGSGGLPSQILLTRAEYDLEVSDPFGTDSYFLLATKMPIPDPSVLDFDGITGERGSSRGGGNPLTDLLQSDSAGRASRGFPLPTDWKIEWKPYLSTPK